MVVREGGSRLHEARLRDEEGSTQAQFWGRYGSSQSAGSRYEHICRLPRPLAMLIWLHGQRRVSEADLADALAATARTRRRKQP